MYEPLDFTGWWRVGTEGVIANPATCREGDNQARSQYLLQPGSAPTHWLLSPRGILHHRHMLARMCEGRLVPGSTPVIRPCVVASWKSDTLLPSNLAKYPPWENRTLGRRMTLDLDYDKHWTGDYPDPFPWQPLCEMIWATVCLHAVDGVHQPMGRVIVYEGRFGEGDKPFSAHMVFTDWYLTPGPPHLELAADLKKLCAKSGLEFDKSVWTSGIKYPYMDKVLDSFSPNARWRGKAMQMIWTHGFEEPPSFFDQFTLCDPLVLIGTDDAQFLKLTESAPMTNTRPTRRLRTEAAPPTTPMEANDEKIADAMVTYYQAMYDSGANPQGGYPQKLGNGCIKIIWRDSSAHECQHRSNNHKSIWFPAKSKMLITCMGSDTPLKVWVPLDEFMEEEELDVPMEESEEEDVDHEGDLLDWIMSVVLTHGKDLDTSVPVYKKEFAASRSLMVTPGWALDDNEPIMSEGRWLGIRRMGLSTAQKYRMLTQLTNLAWCFVRSTGKFLHRDGAGSYSYVPENRMRLCLAPYMVKGKKNDVGWYNRWIRQFDRGNYRDTDIQPGIAIDQHPPHINNKLLRWMIPRFTGKACMKVLQHAPAKRREKVGRWWYMLLRRLVGKTEPANKAKWPDIEEYREACASFLNNWVCQVLFRGTNTQVAVYICEMDGGAGKSLLGQIMQAILGDMASNPETFDRFVNDKWKTSFVGKTLVIIDDSAHNARNRTAASVWKSWITKVDCEVEHKFGEVNRVTWHGNFLTLSNNAFAIPGITRDERRVFALRADADYVTDHFTVEKFKKFGQEKLKRNHKRTLEILTGMLYECWDMEYTDDIYLHPEVQSLRSTIISDNQSVHLDVVIQWMMKRWKEDGTFCDMATLPSPIVPCSYSANWQEPIPRTIVVKKNIYDQFLMDEGANMNDRTFLSRFSQGYADFVKAVDPDTYNQSVIPLLKTVPQPRTVTYQREADGGFTALKKGRSACFELVLPKKGFPLQVSRHGQLVDALREARESVRENE